MRFAFTIVFSTVVLSSTQAGDILRGGAAAGSSARVRAAESQVEATAATISGNASDALKRTTQAVESVRALQDAARRAAAAQSSLKFKGKALPTVPNGLRPGGLEVDPDVAAGNLSLWKGAKLPTQYTNALGTNVTILQQEPTAILNWKTFNVGAKTNLIFNQSIGGERKAEWIAFNKISDPSARPSQILGSIKADGQVYLINQNGIIFGGSSVINVHTLVASTLPINDNLIRQGLLNNRDAQFLFSALPVPGGSDGTPAFNPTISDPEFNVSTGADTYSLRQPLALDGANAAVRPVNFTLRGPNGTATPLIAGTDYTIAIDAPTKVAVATFTPVGLVKINGAPVKATYTPVLIKSGDLIVQAGATMSSPVSSDGNGGRLMLVGPNVTNSGTLSAPAGQTILAAGMQVGIAAHAGDDPSLRGLDVYVGAVNPGSGTSTNLGLIEAYTGSAYLTGREVKQMGVIDGSTSVDLNGRIDLRASYGAVANPNFDNNGNIGFGSLPFIYQKTGSVTLGSDSITQILPDYRSESAVPGFALPQRSLIKVEGLSTYFAPSSIMLAPNADVSIRAGIWPYFDANGDRTVLGTIEGLDPNLGYAVARGTQRFLFSKGQIYLAPTSMINVAGSPEVFVPLAHSILEVEFRGAELADSPLQRDRNLRSVPLTVDLRRSGVFNGRFWTGTPLGDATGLAGLIQRNAAQLTAVGGDVTLHAGGSVVVQDQAVIDVSGGSYRHEEGVVQTTRLAQGGRLVEIADAVPDQIYDGVFTGKFEVSHPKYGITETFSVPFMTGAHFERSYVEGAPGGTLAITAPSMALDGKMLGLTLEGNRQRSAPPEMSRLSISFTAEQAFQLLPDDLPVTIPVSPTPPVVIFSNPKSQAPVSTFSLVGDEPQPLRAERIATVVLSPELLEDQGFGHLTVENPDGDIIVPAGVSLTAPARGSLKLTGANITVSGNAEAHGGELVFRTLNTSPTFVAKFPIVNTVPVPAPAPSLGRGLFTLGAASTLSSAGLLIDDRLGAREQLRTPLAIDGGNITIDTFSADLKLGSVIDVSGGASLNERGRIIYGDGGDISIKTGIDPSFTGVIGGTLVLGSKLQGYSGQTGGRLALKATVFQIGGLSGFQDAVVLPSEFFQIGGFTSYSLTGIGAPSALPSLPGGPVQYVPAISIAAGTQITPTAERWLALPFLGNNAEFSLARTLAPVGVRPPVSLSFKAIGSDDSFSIERIEARGDIVMGKGAKIVTDPGASVSFEGQTVTLLGSVTAPGGTISISGADSFPLPETTSSVFAQATVFLGSGAHLSTAGTATFFPDFFNRRLGTLFPGGTITIEGNIVAIRGSVLDVSGTAAVFDLHPAELVGALPGIERPTGNSGLNSPLWRLLSVPTPVESGGGTIDLRGSEMLFTDATLLGRAGGPTAAGGLLSVFSGRFYQSNVRKNSDINLVVTPGGYVIPKTNTTLGIGRSVFDAAGNVIPGMGYFAANRVSQGGFDSLDLGFKYLQAAPVPFGGNVEFRGPVSISVPGNLRVAAGGVIQTDSDVTLTASYAALGQIFRAPLNPKDPVVEIFEEVDSTGATPTLFFPPLFGTGDLTVKADLIDVGNLSLQKIGRASLIADGGDIRGNGTLNIAGTLTLRAAQVYPTTLADFNIFAYDHSGVPGSVSIVGSGRTAAPLSAGGNLSIFASRIVQGGILRAPAGSITIGWDGTDLDTSDVGVDSPFDPITNGKVAVPVAKSVILQAGSLTSVATMDGPTEMLIPFGLSPDGSSWIDPSGFDVTIGGLPEKRIVLSGDNVSTRQGSTIDIRGGGDLFAYRWIPGPGGSIDLLGNASASWSDAATYVPGDLVTSGGQTWSARVRNSGEIPDSSLFWSLVPESYAIVPGIGSRFAPYAPFNSGENAQALGGDRGYLSDLRLGQSIVLSRVRGLPDGAYTLLPRRYALLPGAFLVTPAQNAPFGSIKLPDGTNLTAGYQINDFDGAQEKPKFTSQFQVLDADELRNRAQYDDYLGNAFFAAAANRSDVDRVQRLPIDSGSLVLHGNVGLRPDGGVLTSTRSNGRGAMVDLSSFGDINLIGGNGAAPAGAKVILNSAILNSWGAESILIGGIRHRDADSTRLEIRTNKIVVNNAGSVLTAPEITLASRAELTLANGSAIASTRNLSEPADRLVITGDGVLLRVSGDRQAQVSRGGVTGSTAPLLTVGDGVRLAGASIDLDSTYGTSIAPTASLSAERLALGSGQISILLEQPSAGLVGSEVTPHLQISGRLLADVKRIDELTLRSYRTIDIYGAGNFASGGSITLLGGGIRGFDQESGGAQINARSVLFSNPSNVPGLVAPNAVSGFLQVNAGTISFGEFGFSATGYENVALNATSGVFGRASAQQVGGVASKPTFSTPGNLTITTPFISGRSGGTQQVIAGGDLILAAAPGGQSASGGLGSSFFFKGGGKVVANTQIILPSGQIAIEAGTGEVIVGGTLDVSGTTQEFYDLIRYSSGGTIKLTSETSGVTLAAGSIVSVAAPDGGGDAGILTIQAGNGEFSANGATIKGSAGTARDPDRASGTFRLDAGSLASYADLSKALNDGGFFEERNLRIRTGDIVIGDVEGTGAISRNFFISTDAGDITVTGTIDASERTGGKIALISAEDLVLSPTANLTTRAEMFNSAGKGGEIRLEAGAAVNGVSKVGAEVRIASLSELDLGVDTFVVGDYTLAPQGASAGSSAFYGKFQGTLHIRAGRNGNDVNVNSPQGSILGASAVVVEGFKLYNGNGVAGDRLDAALRDQMNADNIAYINAGGAAMETRLLAGSNLDPNVLVVAPGVEISNPTGDLQLGTPNNGNGAASSLNTADWDLSSFRYGTKLAPGILTLRAAGDLVFNNALSDGFTPVNATAANGHSALWLAPLADVRSSLPTNVQSWAYRLTAGADFGAADFRAILPVTKLADGKGSLIVGEFYNAIPTNNASATGSSGLTANTIRISTNNTNQGTRFEVIRTGTGSIDVSAGRDVQLRNPFSSIYTAGVRLPLPQTIFQTNDFRAPNFPGAIGSHPTQPGNIGSPQQFYGPILNEEGQAERIAQYSLAGGNISIESGGDIGRYTRINGQNVVDSSRQMPSNWLYRRGYVDPATGLVGSIAVSGETGTVFDSSASTTWWIDYSNFFEGIGTLGGGDISLSAGNDVINVDALAPTNARMAGRSNGVNIAPNSELLLEHGGGDVAVRAGRNIDGGVYYVERGAGKLRAGAEITTNQARSPSQQYLNGSSIPALADSLSWLPTTLFLGRGSFDIGASGDVLLGPVANSFLMPAGQNNKFWYRTYFNSYSADSTVRVSSLGGDVTHRLETLQPGSSSATSILGLWINTQNTLFSGSTPSASFFQPWVRLAEGDISTSQQALTIMPPRLFSTSLSGDINLVGKLDLFPSATGTLELVARGQVIGLQKIGTNAGNNAYSTSRINISDADPATIPSVLNPLAFFVPGLALNSLAGSTAALFLDLNQTFRESGSFIGDESAITAKQARHDPSILHAKDPDPVRIYAKGGDIAGLTLFSPKASKIFADRDIADVAFYLQNANAESITIVSAGRDIIPSQENSGLRAFANSPGNIVVDVPIGLTVSGRPTNALAGDIQINGPGVLEVLAGRNLDLGFGENLTDGRGVGITSIGNNRNPYLPIFGADIIALAGVTGPTGSGPALGLSGSSLTFEETPNGALSADAVEQSSYLSGLKGGTMLSKLTPEQQAIVSLEDFFRTLRDAGRIAVENGDYSSGFAAIDALFGASQTGRGEVFTRSRDIRTSLRGTISLLAPKGGVTMASDIFGNPLTPPGIVTEAGGGISVFTDGSVDIGSARIFTLRGGNIVMWSSTGNIAAGISPRTVATAPPTRVVIDSASATVQTDLGGLATGGGIGVLAAVKGVPPGDVDLIAPVGFVDAGDAGIRVTGNLNIAASAILNAGNIQVGGTSAGVPTVAPVAAPNLGAVAAGNNAGASQAATANEVARDNRPEQAVEEEASLVTVEILSYGEDAGI